MAALKSNWVSGDTVAPTDQNDIATALNAVYTSGLLTNGDRLSTLGLGLAQASGIINF